MSQSVRESRPAMWWCRLFRIHIRTTVFLLISIAAFLAGAQNPVTPANTGVIQGIIQTNANPPEPVSGAQVSLNIAQAARGFGVAVATTVLDTTTDEGGHFVFKDLYPGPYQLRFSKDGLFPAPGSGIQATGTTLSTPAGARGGNATTIATVGFALNTQPVNLSITMVPGGVISGRVVDSNSRAIVNGQVYALQLFYQDGQRTLASRKTTTTNDRGEYRLYGLEPGEYFIRAEVRRAPTNANAGIDISRSYYPGSDDANRATRIRTESGTETGGVNFSVPIGTLLKISGNIIAPPKAPSPPTPANAAVARGAAQPLPNLYLIPDDRDGIHEDSTYSQTQFGNTPEDRAAGKFELRGVSPGRYELYAMLREPNNPQARSAGHTEVNVGNQDVTGVRIVLVEGSELRLHFVSSDATLLSQAPTQVRLLARNSLPPAIASGNATLSQSGAADWRTYSGVLEGQYLLDSPLASLRSAYVADIRQGERSVYESGAISVGSSSAEPVEIVLASPAGTVTGTVQAPGGKPVGGVQVVLIPNPPRRQSLLLYKRATTTSDGQFTLPALAPGAYKLFAGDNLPSGAELSAEFMKAFEDSGVPITVEAGAQMKVEVPLIPAR